MAELEFISASKIHKFLACPLLFKADYLDPHGPEIANIYMIYGTALHYALEWFFTNKRDVAVPENSLVIATWENAFMREIEEAKTEIEYDTPSVRQAMRFSAKESLNWYLDHIAINIRPKLLEHKFELQLASCPIKIRGVIDNIDEDDVVIDYKSAGLDWKKKFSPHNLENNIQLRLYSIAFRKEFKKLEKRTEYHIFPRCQAEVIVQDKFNKEEEIQYVLKLATTMSKIIKLGVLMPNLANCEKCPLNNSCPKLPWVEQAGGFIKIS